MNSKLSLCKTCGQEIAKSAKVCPNCGGKNKKPIFTKWWFWVLIVMIIGIGAGASGGQNADNVKVDDGTNTEISDQTSKNTTEVDDSVQKENVSLSKLNATKKAKDYLKFSAFSRQGLINQLEFEQFSTEDATYGVDHCDADWNEQAAKKAKDYLKFSAFSRQGLIDQLEFEGFTNEQAVYGVNAVGL